MPKKKKTIIEEQLPDETEDIIEIEAERENNEKLEEVDELTPAEKLSEFIETLKNQQEKDYLIKIFKKYKNKKVWIDTIYEPESIPDEAEIKDRYGSGHYEIMLIYKENGKTKVKSINYNIAEFEKPELNTEDYEDEIDYETTDLNSLLALMIERDKEFARQQINAMQNQFNMIMQLMMTQQNQMLQTIATILSSQRQNDYSGLADLIQTIAQISGVAPQENTLSSIISQVLPMIIPLLQKNENANKELIENLQKKLNESKNENK